MVVYCRFLSEAEFLNCSDISGDLGQNSYPIKGEVRQKNLSAQSFYPTLTKRSFKRQF